MSADDVKRIADALCQIAAAVEKISKVMVEQDDRAQRQHAAQQQWAEQVSRVGQTQGSLNPYAQSTLKS